MGTAIDLNLSTAPTAGHFYAPGVLLPLEAAAARLGAGPQDLRARCERLAERCGDLAVAQLDDGVVGFEVRGAWRFRFPVRSAESGAEEQPK